MPSVSEPVVAGSFVPLRGGFVVRVEAIVLLLDLEARGVRLSRDGDDILIHRPCDQVTAEDRAALRQFKTHILALVDYCSRAAIQ